MNERFVCIKVDREERPDVDAIYMDAVQAMTGHGGWPLNAFLTPRRRAVLRRHLLPARAARRDAVVAAGRRSASRTRGASSARRSRSTGRRILAAAGGARAAPARRGRPRPGERSTPRSPCCGAATTRSTAASRRARRSSRPRRRSSSCCARGERQMALHTLRAMASGGMYDQVGGGFARYSVDARWVIPHFEKMLYDNALLARAYLHGFQVSGEPFFARVCTETLDWALRDLRQEEGGFASALDADSEGEEGRFYVWTPDEMRAALGDDARARRGGARVLRPRPARRTSRAAGRPCARRATRRRCGEIKARLRAAREQRVVAGARRQAADRVERADDLRARRRGRGARARRTTPTPRSPARSSSWRDLRDADGRLLRTYNRGQARLGAYLEDHAFLLEALLTLYEATFDPRWFAAARELADTILARFSDPEHGGFFATADDHEPLVARRKELEDTPIPSGASSAAYGLLRLAALTGEHGYEEAALGVLRLLHVGRAAASGRVRPPAAGARLPLRRRQGGRDRRPGRRRRSSASCAARSARTSCSPAARRTASRCWRAASRSTAAPPPTCASTSPAGARSPSPTSSPRCSEAQRRGQRLSFLAPGRTHWRVTLGVFGADRPRAHAPDRARARDAQLHHGAVAQLRLLQQLEQRMLRRVRSTPRAGTRNL